MDVMEKLVEFLGGCPCESDCEGMVGSCPNRKHGYCNEILKLSYCSVSKLAQHLVAHGVTVQECGEWVHPKEYVVSNGFLCSKCGHEEASNYPINPRSGGAYIADENGNFFYPPKLNYCPNCGAKMISKPPKGE